LAPPPDVGKMGENATFAHIWGVIQWIGTTSNCRRISAVVYQLGGWYQSGMAIPSERKPSNRTKL